MRKKAISMILIMCLTVVSIIGYPMIDVQASNGRINPGDVEIVLDDITTAGQAWENMGFDSEDVSDIMKMARKDDSYYQGISEQISLLSNETDETVEIQDALAEQYAISPCAQNGNPPETPQEQNDRIKYVTQVALNRYGNVYSSSAFDNYVLYLYMSHYIDNPNYTKNNPGFDNIYAYVITSDDISAYDNFIAQSNFSMFSSNLVNFVSEFKSAVSSVNDLKTAVSNGKTISINTMSALYELDSFSAEETANRADLIATSFKYHYGSSTSVTNLLNAIYADLESEDITRQYIDTCVTGLLGVLAGTATVFGMGLSISLCYYNVYMNLYDQVRLTTLHYSLSGRVAGRLDELLWG